MPDIQYWFEGSALFQAVAFLFAGSVGVIGIKTIISPKGFGLWLALAIGLSGIAWWQAAKQAEFATTQAETIEKLEIAITGGDNYAYLTVRPAIAPNGENFLAVTTSGPMPRFDASIRFLSGGGKVVTSRELAFRPLPKTTAHGGITLPPGWYRADFIMGEKTWIQHLEFQRTNDGVDQVYWVEKDGEIVKKGP